MGVSQCESKGHTWATVETEAKVTPTPLQRGRGRHGNGGGNKDERVRAGPAHGSDFK